MESQTQTEFRPTIDLFLDKISGKIDLSLSVREKIEKVIHAMRVVSGKECEVDVNYYDGSVFCKERIEVDDRVKKLLDYINVRLTTITYYQPAIYILATTKTIIGVDEGIENYVDVGRLEELFGKNYAGRELEKDSVYKIYIPIDHIDGVNIYLVITTQIFYD